VESAPKPVTRGINPTRGRALPPGPKPHLATPVLHFGPLQSPGKHGSFPPHHRTPHSSSTRAPRARLSSARRSAASLALPPASPTTWEGETTPYPPPSLHLLHHLIHSPLLFTARVCQAAPTAAAAAASDPRFGSSR
jgi:hypothetical protein